MSLQRITAALLGAVLLHATSAAGQQADSLEVYNHRLSLEELGKAVAATRNLDAALRADTSMAARINPRTVTPGPAPTIEAIASRLAREPAANRAIMATGLTPRSYTVAMLSLSASARGLGAVRNGGNPPSTAIADNIQLYRDNRDQFKAWSRDLASMQARPLNADPDFEQAQPTRGDPDFVSPTSPAKNPDMETP